MATRRRGFAGKRAKGRRGTAGNSGRRPAHTTAGKRKTRATAELEPAEELVSDKDRAAFHRDTAAHHDAQASRYHRQGAHGRAALHADSARSHGQQADDYEAAVPRDR